MLRRKLRAFTEEQKAAAAEHLKLTIRGETIYQMEAAADLRAAWGGGIPSANSRCAICN
jgi:hypothetical protein